MSEANNKEAILQTVRAVADRSDLFEMQTGFVDDAVCALEYVLEALAIHGLRVVELEPTPTSLYTFHIRSELVPEGSAPDKCIRCDLIERHLAEDVPHVHYPPGRKSSGRHDFVVPPPYGHIQRFSSSDRRPR